MTIDDMAEIAALFNAVYDEEFPPARIRAWFLVLEELPGNQAKAAAVRICRTSPYLPKPADITRAISGTPEDIEVLLDAEAEAACAHFEAALSDSQIIDYGSIINAIVRDMGGVDAVAVQMADGEWKFQRSRFKTLWKAYRRGIRDPGEAARPPIPRTILESMNAAASEWHSLALPKDQWLAQLQPINCRFEPASLPAPLPALNGAKADRVLSGLQLPEPSASTAGRR